MAEIFPVQRHYRRYFSDSVCSVQSVNVQLL